MTSLPKFTNTAELITSLKEDETIHCFCPTVLNQHVNFFIENFPGTVAYAVKANPTPALLEAVTKAGISYFDVASVAEIALLRSIAPSAHLLYDNPVKSRREIKLAYQDYQVRSFAVGDARELQKIVDVIGADPNVEISIRFQVDDSTAVYDLGSKFGADEQTTIELLKKVRAVGYQTALTFHPGSQCLQEDAYNSHIEAAARIEKAAEVELVMLNIGGGFPTVYPNSGAPALETMFTQIGNTFNQHFPDRDVLLVCEPGRALADPAITTVTRVKHRRDKPVVFLNNGIYGDFMEQLLAHVEMPTRVYRDGELLEGPTQEFKVFGPTCDSLDVFSYDVPLPADIDEGDWIEFAEMGGYGSACTTHFNGFTGAEYVEVEEGFTSDHFQVKHA